MFCIAAFIILSIISIFSASQRRMAKKAWGCVARRVTFRACDTSFKEELKAKLLSHVAVKTPRLLKAADIGLEVAAWLLIILTIWSLFVTVKSGLNLYVYGTCNPSNASSCSLGAEACSIETVKPSFWKSVTTGKPHVWVGDQLHEFGKTVTAIPNRMKHWTAEEYIPANATYLVKKDASKPTALEVIDPGCQFCAQLFKNIEAAKFADKYNLTYIPYPIKNPEEASGYKFKHSLHITQYLEAMRLQPLEGSKTPVDWLVLKRIFTEKDDKQTPYQVKINMMLNDRQTVALLQSWMKEFGYSDEQIAAIDTKAHSQEVKDLIAKNAKMVEQDIKTVKIPTIIFDGQRHDGVVEAAKLR